MDPGFCRDCLADLRPETRRCQACGSPRLLRHPALAELAIAHVDCDAFYATIEKRDDPALRDKAVIVGGGKRGVVATACYVARTFGVKSAMPMFKALALCPDATVVKPNMDKYVRVGREVRALMLDLTPAVEPVSIDEAFLDLTGTARLHGRSPAKSLAIFAREVERSIGITISVGLSCNKFLSKIASDRDKPRGFTVLSQDEGVRFLAPNPVTAIYGVGKVAGARFARDGYPTVGDLQRASEFELARRYGAEGQRLSRLARGIDHRPVRAERETKSVSAETTFERDTAAFRDLKRHLWRLTERVSARMKAKGLSGSTVTLKLKTADFKLRTRSRGLHSPTDLADAIFVVGDELLKNEADGTAYRLIGIGLSDLEPAKPEAGDLLDGGRRKAAAEHAVDRVRAKFGHTAIVKGLAFEDSER